MLCRHLGQADDISMLHNHAHFPLALCCPPSCRRSPCWNFPEKHLGPRANEVATMCHAVGVDSVRELVEKEIPSPIRTESVFCPSHV